MRITTALKAVSAIVSILVNVQPVQARPDYYFPPRNLREYYGRIASERYCASLVNAKTGEERAKVLGIALEYGTLGFLSLEEELEISASMLYTHTAEEQLYWIQQGAKYGLNNYNICKEARK